MRSLEKALSFISNCGAANHGMISMVYYNTIYYMEILYMVLPIIIGNMGIYYIIYYGKTNHTTYFMDMSKIYKKKVWKHV